MTKRGRAAYAGAVLAGVIIDQLGKWLAESSLTGRGVVPVIDGYFELRLSHNRGAFFSMGQHLPDQVRVGFFVIATLFALVLLARAFERTRAEDPRSRVGLALLCGGAIGNLIDRLQHGAVTDFLHLHLREIFHWATFNIADIYIACGLGLLVLDVLRAARTQAR